MNTNRPCGCKSFRTCIICETELGLASGVIDNKLTDYKEVWHYDIDENHCINKEKPAITKPFPGISVIENFVTVQEESVLVSDLDNLPWDTSQSGRRKQNYGPRANFKKRKVKVGPFNGFPACTKFVQDRFATLPILEGFTTVEQCSIEYRKETGASIEPHIDDCWIWGERIVQLNLLSDTVLSLTPFVRSEKPKYNLNDVENYPRVIGDEVDVVFSPLTNRICLDSPFMLSPSHNYPATSVVRIPLPARSLLIMWGSARYEWEHAIWRSDIENRRIVLAYRELTPPYLPGGKHQTEGEPILEKSKLWWNQL